MFFIKCKGEKKIIDDFHGVSEAYPAQKNMNQCEKGQSSKDL
jgi:hypothetical protein